MRGILTSNMPTSSSSVTLDASFVIGLCANEPEKGVKAQTELNQRIADGSVLHAPHLLLMEAVFVLCGKLRAGTLTQPQHSQANASLHALASVIQFPDGGDITLLLRADQMQQGYGCSHSADCFYIALAEQLAAAGSSELLTFDAGQQKQAAAVSPNVKVTLLTA